MKFKRILVKLSGEGLANKSKSLAIDYVLVEKIALQLKKIVEKGVQVSVVIGGGNFWRGASAEKMVYQEIEPTILEWLQQSWMD